MLGWENLFHCEINDFGRAVLDYWFPNSESYGDITKTDFSKWGGESMSSQEDSLVSLFPTQERETERRMTATSGRRCSVLLNKSGRLGLSVRMLMESERWWNRVTGFRWDASPLFSERVTTLSMRNTPSSPSSESAEILSQSDIPSNRLLFRLVPCPLLTGETESSLLLTPTAVMTCEKPEDMRARAEKKGYRNGTQFGSLESQVMYGGLLKTPCSADSYSDNMKSRGVSGTSGTLAQEVASGYVERRMPGLLPTPTATDNPHNGEVDAQGRRWTEGAKTSHSLGISDMATMGLLPTPRVSDIEGAAVKNVEYKDGKWSRENAKGVRWGVKIKDVVEGYMVDALLPTPRANKVNGTDLQSESLANRNHSNLEEVIAKRLQEGMLPTPRTCSSMGASLETEGMVSEKRFPNLEVVVAKTLQESMLPTPTTHCCNDGTTRPRKDGADRNSELNHMAKGWCEMMESSEDSSRKKDGQSFRLSPLFTEEMMGFPLMWTTLPFLSPSGERKASKHTETQ